MKESRQTDTSTQTSIDFDAARKAGERGRERAERSAGAAWNAKAYELAMLFLAMLPAGRRFRTEQIRAFADGAGLWAPPTNRAWGAVTTRLAKEGQIRRVGYEPTTNVKAHGTLASVWTKN